MATPDEERRESLISSVQALAGEVSRVDAQLGKANTRLAALAARNTQTETQTRRNKRTARLAVIGLLLDWALFGVLFLLFDRESETTDRLEVQVREQCGLLSLFLGSYRPESRASGLDRDTYESNFVQLRQSYRTLGCRSPIVPPATPAPPR